jgi:hypothetical protein
MMLAGLRFHGPDASRCGSTSPEATKGSTLSGPHRPRSEGCDDEHSLDDEAIRPEKALLTVALTIAPL